MSEEELRAIIGSAAKTIKEIGEEHKKTEAALASLAEEHKKTELVLASLAEEHKKTEAAQQKTEVAQQKTEAAQQKTEAAIRELRKELGGVGRTQGEIAEDIFRRNLAAILKQRGFPVGEIHSNLKTPDAEFDLLAVNGKKLILTEVKSRLENSDIHKLVHKQIPAFKDAFGGRYKGHKIIGALAALAIDADLERQAEEAGLYVFTQSKEGGASLANSPDFKPKFY